MNALHKRFAIFLVFGLSVISGCRENHGQWGQWKGTVAPVHVINGHKEIFEVASLRIKSGSVYNPQGPWKHVFGITPDGGAADVPESLGGGKQPLLVVGPEYAMTIKAGEITNFSTIEVQGWMLPSMVTVPLDSKSQYGGFVWRDQNVTKFEHVIILRRYRIDGQGKWIDVPLDPLK